MTKDVIVFFLFRSEGFFYIKLDPDPTKFPDLARFATLPVFLYGSPHKGFLRISVWKVHLYSFPFRCIQPIRVANPGGEGIRIRNPRKEFAPDRINGKLDFFLYVKKLKERCVIRPMRIHMVLIRILVQLFS